MNMQTVLWTTKWQKKNLWSVLIKVIIYKGGSHISFSKSFFYINNQLDPSANEFCNSIIFLLVLHNYFNFSSTLFSKIVSNFYRLPGHEKFVVLVMSIFDQCSGEICAKFWMANLKLKSGMNSNGQGGRREYPKMHFFDHCTL